MADDFEIGKAVDITTLSRDVESLKDEFRNQIPFPDVEKEHLGIVSGEGSDDFMMTWNGASAEHELKGIGLVQQVFNGVRRLPIRS